MFLYNNDIIQFCQILVENQYFISIFTSLISALIFWLFFDWRPKRSRKKKLRPKIEYELYCLYLDLFQYFDTCFKHADRSPSSFQAQIRAGILTKEDFEIGLYNKCLTIDDKYDENKDKLMPIGDKLESISRNINQMSDSLFLFNQELTVKEILLLRKILIKTQAYNYESDSLSYINGLRMVSVNPTIHYMLSNIFDLYKLYICLQKEVHKFKNLDKIEKNNLDRSIITSKAFKLKTLKQYKECIKLSKKYAYLSALQIESKYELGLKENCLKSLKVYLHKEKENLIYLRGYFNDIYMDEEIKNVMIEVRSENEYNEMVQCILHEKQRDSLFLEQNKKLKDYYTAKCNY